MNKYEIAAATPATIDAKLAELYAAEARLEAELARVRAAQAPLEAEYEARGRWTRAFLVNNTSGHVHSSMSCSSCFPTTAYKWVTDLSGATEAEIIDAAGWRACTVCFPDAPVEALKGETRLLSDEDVDKAARKAERDAATAAKKAKAAADACPMPNGEPLVAGYNRPKTERAVRNLLSSEIKSVLTYRIDRGHEPGEVVDGVTIAGHPSEPEWLETIGMCLEALEHKTGEAREEILAAALDRAIKAERRAWRKAGREDVNLEGAAKMAGLL